jgi:alpha-maltose-1-phosphate synthase
MKPKIAIVRGKFLNKYEMQFFEPLTARYDVTAFGSLTPFHDTFAFPVVKLPSPMDIPNVSYKMPVLNRLFIDAHYLFGLESKLKGFDLVHTAETYFRYTQQCLDARKKGYVKKVIATVLETIPFNNEGIRGRKAYKKRSRTELDHIIALTQKAKDALITEGTDPDKITIIHHYVDTKRFAPGVQTQKRRFDVKKKSFRILFSGRLEIYKGVYDIIEAAERLLTDNDLKDYHLQFVFAGEGTQKGEMISKESALRLRNVFHTSASYDEMPAMYEKADIFIAPSKPTATYEEQYCTVLLEAQAAGLPIVTTNTGGIPENIGSAGIVVAPGNVSAIAEAVKRYILYPDVRRSYGKRARTRAVTHHDKYIGAKKLSTLYAQVLAT